MGAGASQDFERPLALIVDDDLSNLRLASDCLEASGLSVMVARDGRKALERAQFVSPDLIVLDVKLPGIDGFEACRRLKATQSTRDIPVIFMTSPDEARQRVAAYEAGGSDYVTKPIEATELVARAKTQLALRHAQTNLARRNAQLNTTLDSIGQGVCFFDAAGRLILSNRRYAEIYNLAPEAVRPGMSLEEIVGLRYAAGVCPNMSREAYVDWGRSVLTDAAPQMRVFELQTGKVVRIHHQTTPDGGWVSAHEDITEAWLAGQALDKAHAETAAAEKEARSAHDQLLDALDVIPEGFALFDAEDRYVLWNPRYEGIYAKSGGKIVKGMSFENTLRAGLARGQYEDAIGREEEWLAERLARHSEAKASHEQRLSGDRWVRVEERRTCDGGSVGIRIDITELKRREASFRLLFETSPVPMWVYDRETLRFLDVNQAAIDHYGYSSEQFLSMTVLDIRGREDWEAVRTAQATAENEGSKPQRTWLHIRADGSEIEVLVYSRRMTYEGRAASLIAIIDITERKRAERELETTREFLHTVIENVPVTVFVKDAVEQRYLLVNKAGEAFLGVPRERLVGSTVDEVLPPEIAAETRRRDAQLLDTDGPVLTFDEVADTAAAGMRRLNTSSVAIRDKNGKPQYLLRVVEDVTELRAAELRIARLALHDPLTDLPNRAAANEKLEQLLDQCQADGRPFAVLCLDLDRFKEVNDVFGHNIGDRFLCGVAERLSAAAGAAFVSRFGGDEFLLLSTEGDEPTAAAALADRIIAALSEEMTIDGHRMRAGVSIGVAISPTDGMDVTTLIANADAALYRAKRDGRGTARFFEPEMDRRLREKRALERDLHAAIAEGQLAVHYQPQARIDGEIIGFEALARWRHPTLGMVPPSVFVPLAEECGLILDLGKWVLHEACREAASWPRELKLAVNLSSVQFKHCDLPALVHATLLETGLAPQRLELEITESVLIDDSARALAILQRLKALGVRVAMDDFGTGYSSLSYLQSFPFDKLKIDQSFISRLPQPQSTAIIRAVIGLGRGLNLPVVAEGVETHRQLQFLAKEACDEVQGYLIGRPSPIADYAALVGRRSRRPREKREASA